MHRPIAVLALLLTLGGGRSAVASPPLVARLETEFGTLRIQLLPEHSPRHVENFQRLVEGTLYDGSTFHRVIPGYLIQGGSPTSRDNDPANDNFGNGGYGIPLERSELRHVRGAVAMARDVLASGGAPESSGAQFFIVLGDAPMLDEIEFSIFGRVIEGMDVADRIAAVGRDQTNYDRPLRPVRIQRLVMERRASVDAVAESAADVGRAANARPAVAANPPIAATPPIALTSSVQPTPTPPLATPAPAPRQPDGPLRVAQSLVNVRAAPSTTAGVVARLPAGTDVRILSQSGEWLEVDLTEGRSGYIRRDMLESSVGSVD